MALPADADPVSERGLDPGLIEPLLTTATVSGLVFVMIQSLQRQRPED